MYKLIFILAMLLPSIFGQSQTPDANGIIYVKKGATGSGANWNSPIGELADALKAAKANTAIKEIWVAKGIYKPLYRADNLNGANAADRDNSFVLVKDVKIYGGFDPDNQMSSLSTRNLDIAVTTLSGDVDANNNISNNVYHLVIAVGDIGTAELNGITVSGGNANSSSGAITVNSFSGIPRYEGGGIYIKTSSPKITNVKIVDNNARQGGGLYMYNSSSVISNVIFKNNSTDTYHGAGMYFAGAGSPVITNTLFTNNNAKDRGGAIYNGSNVPYFVNVTISGNTAALGGGIYNISGGPSAKILNSIIYGNTCTANSNHHNVYGGSVDYSYSLIQGNGGSDAWVNGMGINSGNNIDANPLFVNASTGDFKLKAGSPAVDAGGNNLFPGLDASSKDLGGDLRVHHYTTGGIIDLGAFESEHNSPLAPDQNKIIYVKEIATGTGSGNSWDNATSDLHNAIHALGVQKVFVEVGEYKVGDHSFIMKNGVEIYGGFDTKKNIKTLADNRMMMDSTGATGSILNGENVRPVIWNVFTTSDRLNNSAVLNGFTITNGLNTGTDGLYDGGGGIRNYYASPTITNVVFRNNTAARNGGGMGNWFSGSVITNTIFTGNTVTNEFGTGGAISNRAGCTIVMDHAIIRGNSAYNGGGISNYSTFGQTFTNLIITNNSATNSGGGIDNVTSSSTFINSLIASNQGPIYSAGTGRWLVLINSTIARNFNKQHLEVGIFVYNNTLILKNSIVFGDITNDYSAQNSLIYNLSNANMGNGNIDASGLSAATVFVNPGLGDFRLKYGSPAINVGDNSLFPGIDNTSKDLAGNSRMINATVDMGAFEYDPSLPVTFGKLSATIQNGQLLVNWISETESNNSHFLIQVSTDGVHFRTVQTVQSKASDGNSSVSIDYSSVIPFTSLSLGLSFLLMGLFAGRHRRYGIMIAAIACCAWAISCNKPDVFNGDEDGRLFVRIIQVDKDGVETISKTVQAIVE
ncbi:MAG: hypothetical protein E6Q89_01505 [Bacteroidia bacterium]|nr:MAG: hypothetical protein E6Q89_01505 [Bacteroidia bacterium]